MKKFLKVIKLTALMIGLSLLLIGASSLLRTTFINSVQIWQKNLTSTPSGSQNQQTQKQNNLTWHKNLTSLTTPTQKPMQTHQPDTTPLSKSQKSLPLIYAETTTNPPDARYQRVINETPLLKSTNDLDTSASNTLFLLPKSYFVKILRIVTLDSGAEGYYVRYNTYEGYATKSAFSGTMSDNTTSQSGIEITLFDDAGTYLRATPEILDTNTLVLIPASTGGLTLIGKIYGDTPSDGSSNLWYFVEYSTGPTTTHTGYVYSERCNLSKPLTDLVLDTDILATSPETAPDQALSDTSTTSNPDKTLDANLTTTPTLMWIVAIIFIIPIIIVFIMLVKRPRRLADDYDLIANNNEDNINFEFDEAYAPTIKKSNSRTFPKFKTTKLDELSRFIKLDTTIETAKPLDPTESMTNFNELPNQNPNNLKTTINPKIATNIPTKPIKFAKNIRFSPKSLCNSPKTPSYPPKNPSYPPRTLENSIDFANYLQDNDNYLTKNSTFTPEFDVNLPKTLENSSFPQVVDDFTPTSTKNHQSSAKNPKEYPINNQKYTLSADYPEDFTSYPDKHTNFHQSSTKNPEEYPINNQKYTLSADNSTFSPEKYTKKPKKYTHFFSSILNRKQKNQKINKNRKRDEFRPSVLSSDDYFEFADSFELTTPMNSHLVFNSKKPPTTIRSGKKINKH